MHKYCKQCGKKFFKKPTCSKNEWENQTKYCSMPCYRLGHKGSKWTQEQKNKLAEIRKGIKNPMSNPSVVKKVLKSKKKTYDERGRKTPIALRIRTSKRYREWRRSVFKRDDYTCQDCGDKSCKGNRIVLNADHIKPFSQYPKLRFDINNGRTLCVDCHKKTPTYGNRPFAKKDV